MALKVVRDSTKNFNASISVDRNKGDEIPDQHRRGMLRTRNMIIVLVDVAIGEGSRYYFVQQDSSTT